MRSSTLIALLLLSACAADDPFPLPAGEPRVEAVSFLGDSLVPPPAPDSLRAAQWTQLDSAHAAVEANPDDPDAWIWLGRRLGYLGYYREAIAAYTAGLTRWPDEPRLLRHRGHRWITVRQLDSAVHDLAGAAQLVYDANDDVEPDGQPNARGVPTSTLQFNIWYHLGLAFYLRGDFRSALHAYRECMDVSGNPDAQVATSYWLYLTLRRVDSAEAAAEVLEPITRDMDIVENGAYHRLLLMYEGQLTPADLLTEADTGDGVQNATVGYGVGTWFLLEGDTGRAMTMYRDILAGPQWAAFGHLAAEAEVARTR